MILVEINSPPGESPRNQGESIQHPREELSLLLGGGGGGYCGRASRRRFQTNQHELLVALRLRTKEAPGKYQKRRAVFGRARQLMFTLFAPASS